MTQLNSQKTKRLIVGLGMTGLSAARFCQRQGWSFDLCDTREDPSNLEAVKQEFSGSQIFCGALHEELLQQYDELVVSPGIALAEPAIQHAIQQGVKISGDIQLFHEFTDKPVIAITGSNGKSTVTSLVGDMLNSAGVKALVGGNIGLPALDLTEDQGADVFVLELSSFQLETTSDLSAAVATILNLSEDHMDRYQGMTDYLQAKQRIFQNASAVVVNLDDEFSAAPSDVESFRFGLLPPKENNFGLVELNDEDWIFRGEQALISASDIKIKGQHNLANVMSALALVEAVAEELGIHLEDTLDAVRSFSGLAHRCQWLTEVNGIACYNDSKGTNVGSTLAAINGLGASCRGKIWLLAGGVDKGQDFSELIGPIKKYVSETLLFGRDACNIRKDLKDCDSQIFPVMADAYQYALKHAVAGDLILLSPACASFDQFKNYAVRGEYFRQIVEESKEAANG